MRLFIAIEFKPDYFKCIQSALPQHLRLVDSFHMTLLFLGDTDPVKIHKKLQTVKHSRFTITSRSVSHFNKNLRVVFVDFEPNKALLQLQQKISSALKIKTNFHPHVTLARVDENSDKKELLKIIRSIKRIPKQFIIRKFHLVSSTLTPTGPRYNILFTYPLTDAAVLKV